MREKTPLPSNDGGGLRCLAPLPRMRKETGIGVQGGPASADSCGISRDCPNVCRRGTIPTNAEIRTPHGRILYATCSEYYKHLYSFQK